MNPLRRAVQLLDQIVAVDATTGEFAAIQKEVKAMAEQAGTAALTRGIHNPGLKQVRAHAGVLHGGGTDPRAPASAHPPGVPLHRPALTLCPAGMRMRAPLS